MSWLGLRKKKIRFRLLVMWSPSCFLLLLVGCSPGERDYLAEAEEIPKLDVAQHSATGTRGLDVPSGDPEAPRDTVRASGQMGESMSWRRVTMLRVVDDQLLVGDQWASPLVHVFERKSRDYLGGFGRSGRGPGEVLDASWITRAAGEGARVWVFDSGNRKFVEFERSPRGTYDWSREVRLESPLPPAQPVWTEKGILTNGFFPSFTLMELDRSGSPTRRIAVSPPSLSARMEDIRGAMSFNRNRMAISPSGNRVVLVYQSNSRLDFLNASGELTHSREGPVPIRRSFYYAAGEPQGRAFRWNPEENEWAYVGVDVTEELIFALFCGKGCPEDSPFPNMIHVFGWSGGFRGAFALDRSVATISVSEDGGDLYGYSEEPEPAIYYWEVPAGYRK